MTFRARLFLAIFIFSILPVAYIFNTGGAFTPVLITSISILIFFTLIGALAGAVKVDQIVRSSQERAVASEAALYSFKERISDGIFRTDQEGHITDINTALAEMLNYEASFLRGKVLWKYLLKPGGPPNEALIPHGHSRFSLNMLARSKAGADEEVLVDLFPQKRGGKFDGFIGCVRPAVKALYLEKTKERVSVEVFRSLRACMRGYLEELSRIMTLSKDSAAVSAGLSAATRKTLFGMAPCFGPEVPLKWRPKLRRQEINPRKLLEHLLSVNSYWAQARSRRIKISVTGSPGSFLGDFNYLSELFFLLIDNSVKYTAVDGNIELSCHDSEAGLSFSVTDDGIGVRQVDLAKLGSAFFRAENHINDSEPGLGLGLWTARRIAEAHKASLYIDSSPGKGMKVTLLMPKLSERKDAPLDWLIPAEGQMRKIV